MATQTTCFLFICQKAVKGYKMSNNRRSRGKSSPQFWNKCTKCEAVLWNTLTGKHEPNCKPGPVLWGIANRENTSNEGIISIGVEGGNMAKIVTASYVFVEFKGCEPIVLMYCPISSPVMSICLNKYGNNLY